jgi:hypothetical protein
LAANGVNAAVPSGPASVRFRDENTLSQNRKSSSKSNLDG